ncbi:hypothetical protein TL16_g11361 [Triparma laevis f. inornata]|uniref:Uncharacterized protein n=2 Tax=Triparma laevis TaxID=1534972 RepID=A0A9W7KZ21_9STRA|nr:hypothetical protein TL16_g11361 [Triparma laevis f. inornata]GMI17148.1 hypothetical protein TrLO_g10766 [Triparma laevis f. longispina]
MSKSIAYESIDDHESREMNGKRGLGDEGGENEEEILEATAAANSTTGLAPVDGFLNSVDFRRKLLEYVQPLSPVLLMLRALCTEWRELVEVKVDRGFESGSIIVHGGKDITAAEAWALKKRRKLVTRTIFPLNVTKVGGYACYFAMNLVVVDIPVGVESIGHRAFQECHSLTTVSFPTTLKSIGNRAFLECSSLETVDLLHTHLQELDTYAFSNGYMCSTLTSMTIPDSLQTLGVNAFYGCNKLVPSNISCYDNNAVVAYLRFKQSNP